VKNAVAIIGGVLVLAGIAGILALRDRGGDSGPPTSAPASNLLAETPAPAGSPFEILCRRSREEVLVFARRREFGRPAVGLEVRLLDAAGTVLRIGRTDEFGVLRAAVPEGAVSIACGMGESFVASTLPPPRPPAVAPPLPILADRTFVRPGDTVRFCVWDYGAPEGVLSFEPADPTLGPVTFSWVEELQPGFPGPRKHWNVLTMGIPDDVRPGTAIATIGGARLEIPILPRFGPASEGGPKAEGGALAIRQPVPGGDLKIDLVDDAWRVECHEEFSVALLYATSGGRFLTHGAVPGEGKEALAALFLEDERPAAERVHAIVSTAHGFLEASVPAPASPVADRRLRIHPAPRAGAAVAEDRIRAFVEEDGRTVPAALAVAVEDPSGALPEATLATEETVAVAYAPLALASGGDRHVRVLAVPLDGGPPLRAETTVLGAEPAGAPSGPSWIYDGDVVAGAGRQPPTRPALLEIRRFLRPGESMSLAEPGIAVPVDSQVTFVVNFGEKPTSVRVKAGEEILFERSSEEPHVGTVLMLEAARIGDRPVLLESASVEAELDLVTAVPVRAAEVAASEPDATTGLALALEIPAKVTAGGTAEIRARIAASSAVDEEFVVRLPLPRGAVPDEDGWSIRKRAPEGAHVELAEDSVVWRLDRLEPGTTLSLRVQFPWKGRFSAPPATVRNAAESRSHARSAGSVVVVE
jgi:hypothetical protein